MGHRAKLIDASEWDALCRRSKALLRWRPGARKLIKRRFNKRQRAQFITPVD